MQKFLITGLGLAALLTFPAMADGYETGKTAQRGPAPLAPHAKEVEVVKVIHEARTPVQHYCNTGCPTVSYGHTYVTEPVTTRQYTRSYTRMAAPDCRYVTSSYPAPHHSTHGRRGHNKYHSHHHGQVNYGPGYASGVQYASPAYSSGPVYEEGTVIWQSENGQHDHGYRTQQTSSYQPSHADRGQAWAHYDHSWKRRTNQGR